MELRAAATISGDHAMTKAFEQGLDLHRLTASRMTGKDPADVTNEERKGAKCVNFGSIYGQGAGGLVQAAWDQFDIVLDFNEAKAWQQAFENACRVSCNGAAFIYRRCEGRRYIAIGKDMRPRDRPGLPHKAAFPKADRSTRAVAICPSKGPAPTPRCWRSLTSTIGCSTPGLRVGRSPGCTTRLCSKSAPTRPGSSFDSQAGDDRRLRRALWRTGR